MIFTATDFIKPWNRSIEELSSDHDEENDIWGQMLCIRMTECDIESFHWCFVSEAWTSQHIYKLLVSVHFLGILRDFIPVWMCVRVCMYRSESMSLEWVIERSCLVIDAERDKYDDRQRIRERHVVIKMLLFYIVCANFISFNKSFFFIKITDTSHSTNTDTYTMSVYVNIFIFNWC